MLATAVIDKKRDFGELQTEEIQFMIRGLTDGSLPDYQIAAWAMAVLCRGMTDREIADLTDCMLNSGRRLNRATNRPRVDKHSTGGLGDKISLPLAPMLACHDVDVPMLSGRGLGITGGTLDKLESFAGYRCNLTEGEIESQLKKIGCVITGTTPDITPADRKLYALRDVTGTVPSVALITASIMSKKLAASLDALVLDVKCGSGAFMREEKGARELARSLCATGERFRVTTKAILTCMDQPLGKMVGNACEVNESIELMEGGGPQDVRDLTIRLCAELLVAVKRFDSMESASSSLARCLDDGSALARFEQMVVAQGAQFSRRLQLAEASEIIAEQSGWIAAIDGQEIGRAVIELGGGRRAQGEALIHDVGLEMLVQVGDAVEVGQPLVRMFAHRHGAESERRILSASSRLHKAFQLSSNPASPLPLYLD